MTEEGGKKSLFHNQLAMYFAQQYNFEPVSTKM